MDFRVLGPVEFAVDGRRLGPSSGHQQRLLAVLLAAGGDAVSADRLIDATWGSTPPPSARASLHSHVSRLRNSLADAHTGARDVLLTDPHGYRVVLAGHDLDAARFEALVARAHDQLDTAPEQALQDLDEALGLWRGAAFGDLASHELIRPEAVRLERLRATAAADRVDATLALGDHRAVVGQLEAMVADDPLDERASGQLMRALYLAGRQADALGVYERLRHALVGELGADPSQQLRDLHRRILRQDAEVAVAAGGAVTRSTEARIAGTSPGSSPHGAVELIGRDEELAALSELVTSARVVTVTGPGGVGKSRLAEAVGVTVAARFEAGVAWCELAGVRDPGSLPTALLTSLGLHQEGERAPEDHLLLALTGRRLLLVLDNGEHLVGAVASLVDRISRHCARVAMLVTSRAPLRLSQEQLWQLAPLDLPAASADAAAVEASPAGRLLCLRARAVDPTFALTDDNAATIASLCRRLDGLPLALELAAARLRALSPEALASRLDQRFELLTGGSHREAGRHRTLEAVVDWSYGLLTDTEARLFDRLSIFAGTFPLEAAEEMGADAALPPVEVAGVLSELVDKCLVAVEHHGPQVRYRLLETLRAYGRRRLAETGRLETVRRAHATYHVQVAEALGARLRGPDEQGALADLDAAVDDLRSAHAWLLEHGEADGALRLPSALHDELTFRPREEAFAWVEGALQLPDAQRQPAYPAALATAARAALNRGELRDAARLAESAVGASQGSDLVGLWARYVLTTVALYEGRLDDALQLAEQRLDLASRLEQDVHLALAGVSRVLALRYRGDGRAAVEAATQARRDADASGNHTARAWALYSSGEALLDADPDEAAALLEQAIEAARRVDRRFIEGVALVSLASLSGRSGHSDRALELFRDAVAHWRTLGVHTQQLTTLRNLVELFVRVDADEPAAFLHGAVTTGATPSFGDEAQRLDDAWDELERRLGAEVARTAAARGRGLGTAAVVDEVLGQLDHLTAVPRGP